MSVALSLLLVYDTLLSLDQEVEYIWNGELSSVKILYFCTRYGIICSSMISMALMFPTGMSSRFCYGFFILYDWSGITAIPIAVIMALRTRALYVFNHKAIIVLKAFFLLFLVSEVAAWIMITVGFQVLETPEVAGGSCFQRVSISPIALAGSDMTFANAAWYDSVIFIMTVIECFKLLRSANKKDETCLAYMPRLCGILRRVCSAHPDQYSDVCHPNSLAAGFGESDRNSIAHSTSNFCLEDPAQVTSGRKRIG